MAYFGQLVVDNSTYLVGSTLYGVCNTSAGTSAKIVNSGVLGNSFDELIAGISINIQFTKGSTNDTITLKVGSTQTLDVVGNCKCNANAILQFTYGQVSGVGKWILNAGEKTATTVMHTYDSTSSEPISGRGVAEAIAPLVPGGDSAAAYSVDTSIGDNPSSSKVPTSLAVANYVHDAFAREDAMVYKGTLGIGGTVANVPVTGYSAGHVYRVITAARYAGYQCSVGDLLMAITDASSEATAITPSHWAQIRLNFDGAVFGPQDATTGHIAIFGVSGQEITDSGYTIATSVPANAVFTDTHYEDTGTVQAITGITAGNEFNLAQVTQGRLHIAEGFSFTKATVSTGIQEVV